MVYCHSIWTAKLLLFFELRNTPCKVFLHILCNPLTINHKKIATLSSHDLTLK